MGYALFEDKEIELLGKAAHAQVKKDSEEKDEKEKVDMLSTKI